MSSYIELAFKITRGSTHSHHHMAAVVIKGGCVMSSAYNLGKWHACCERRAIRPNINYRGATIIVVRKGGGISKPCSKCWDAIVTAGIKKVVYFNHARELVIEKTK